MYVPTVCTRMYSPTSMSAATLNLCCPHTILLDLFMCCTTQSLSPPSGSVTILYAVAYVGGLHLSKVLKNMINNVSQA
jgi:hypothetical protein